MASQVKDPGLGILHTMAMAQKNTTVSKGPKFSGEKIFWNLIPSSRLLICTLGTKHIKFQRNPTEKQHLLYFKS